MARLPWQDKFFYFSIGLGACHLWDRHLIKFIAVVNELEYLNAYYVINGLTQDHVNENLDILLVDGDRMHSVPARQLVKRANDLLRWSELPWYKRPFSPCAIDSPRPWTLSSATKD